MSQIKIILIRHGEAENKWGEHPDPGLSLKGISESYDLLQHKELQSLEDYFFISSPKLRAIETAKPLAKKFNKKVKIDNCFIEIPAEGIKPDKKQEWLEQIVQTNKKELPMFIKNWKNKILNKIKKIDRNTIIFSHFMVINALLSELNDMDTLLYFYPGHTSVVILEMKNKEFDYFITEGNKKTAINL
tara:strand:- start:21 stop:584 length:564 start_codon:yes stop_codon:yes gene_type:complete